MSWPGAAAAAGGGLRPAGEPPSSLGHVPEAPGSRPACGGLPGPEDGDSVPLVPKLEVTASGAVVLWGRGAWPGPHVLGDGRPGTPADLDAPEAAVDSPPRRGVAGGVALAAQDPCEPPDACAPEPWAVDGDAQVGPGGAPAPRGLPAGLGLGGDGVAPKRGAAASAGEGAPRPCSEPESADELGEVQMRVTICPRDGGPADAPAPTPPAPRPRALAAAAADRPAPRDAEAGAPRRKQGVWGKGGGRPGNPALPAAAGGPPKASPKRKVSQKKKPLWDPSTGALGRAFHPWGQRRKSAPAEAATFPPIAGAGPPGRANKRSLLPLRPKQSRSLHAGRRCAGKRSRELQPPAREEPEPPVGSVRPGEFINGESNPKGPQEPAGAPSAAPNQRSVSTPRRSASSGDQEPPACPPPALDEMLQQVPGVQGCPRCPELQKEIEKLRRQLAALQSLKEKFQTLSS